MKKTQEKAEREEIKENTVSYKNTIKLQKITVIEKPLDGGPNKYNQEIGKIKNRIRPRVENMIFERPFIGILLHKESF